MCFLCALNSACTQPGLLKAEQVTVLPSVPLVRYDSAGNVTVFTIDALSVSHFSVAIAFSLEAVYTKCGGATWWYPESEHMRACVCMCMCVYSVMTGAGTVVRYAVYGGVLVGGAFLCSSCCCTVFFVFSLIALAPRRALSACGHVLVHRQEVHQG